jgi:hypothetical protein
MNIGEIEEYVSSWVKKHEHLAEERLKNFMKESNSEILQLERRIFLLENPYKITLLSRVVYEGKEYIVFNRYCRKAFSGEDTEEIEYFKFYTIKNADGHTYEVLESEIFFYEI